MGVIVPTDYYEDDSSSLQNSTEYPSAVTFFQVKESVGASSLTDTITSSTVALASCPAGADAYSKGFTISSPTTYTGAFPIMVGSATMLVGVFDDDAQLKLRFGTSVSNLLVEGNNCYAELGAYVAGGVWTYTGKLVARATLVNTADDKLYRYEYDGTNYNAMAGDDILGSPIYNALPSFMLCPNSANADQYGYALHQFDSKPADATIKAMLIWCFDNWQVGNKALYPGFRKIS